MKVGFIGLGRMGQAMSRRLLDSGYEVAVYNRTADKTKPLLDLGAKPAASIGEVSNFGRAVFTMLTDDAAVMDVVGRPGGLREAMPMGGIHICAGTHSVAAIGALQELHKVAGQILIAAPVSAARTLSRPATLRSSWLGRRKRRTIVGRYLRRSPGASSKRVQTLHRRLRSNSPTTSWSVVPLKP